MSIPFRIRIYIWSELGETMNLVRRGKLRRAIQNLEKLIVLMKELDDEKEEDVPLGI